MPVVSALKQCFSYLSVTHIRDGIVLGTMTFGEDWGSRSSDERNPYEHTTHETNHR
jgi:hypothetical protein